MSYKALYRTYRPSTFEEVAGQQHIVQTIKNSINTGKIAHAYLFAGPRGTGKTTMAKLLAKALNCDEGAGHQCNHCRNCVAINEGTHPDVLEIDAASNNGVEEVRNLIEKIRYSTILGKYKVYIIDEVHMMTPAAFNALLKTLEEPPENVVFILATTEPHKILPTILSRCQRYDFTKVSDEDIKARIKNILEQEHILFNEEAVNVIISLADGGMRDALSLLDQVLAYSGDKLVLEDVLKIFSLESKEEKIQLISSICFGNISDVLTKLNHYIVKGSDIKRLTSDLLVILKDVLIFKQSNNADFLEMLSVDDAKYLSGVVKQKDIMTMIETLLNTLKEYKFVTNINPLFEVTLLKLTSLNKAEDEETLIESTPQKVEEIKESKPQEVAPIKETKEMVVLDGSLKDDKFVIDDETMIKIMISSKKEIKNALNEKWVILKRLTAHPELGRAASMLVDAHVLVASNNMVVLEFPLSTTAEKINKLENQKEVQNVMENVIEKQVFVYAISRNESVRLQTTFLNMKEAKKLPKLETVNLDFIKR